MFWGLWSCLHSLVVLVVLLVVLAVLLRVLVVLLVVLIVPLLALVVAIVATCYPVESAYVLHFGMVAWRSCTIPHSPKWYY